MEVTEKSESQAITHLAMRIDTEVTYHIVAMEKVAEQHIFKSALNPILLKL